MVDKTKVLLIEDSQDIRESTTEILEFANYEVFVADNGKLGVQFAQLHQPDIILCDVMMPQLDGYGVLYLLRINENTSSIPFIFLTAKAERSDVRKGMDMGADDYLTKPFDDIELLNAIESRLKKGQQQKKYQHNALAFDSLLNEARSAKLLKDLSESSRLKAYKKKQSVFMEGDNAAYVYLVNSGSVRTFLIDQDGREMTVGLYGPEDFFGYEAILLNKAAKESAEILEAGELCLISREEFNTLIFRDHGISKKFIELLSGNIREKQDHLLKLAYNSVRKRLADALLQLVEKFGGDDHDALTIQTSREDLAAMAGTSSETISRTLSDFKQEKLIEKTGGNIRILSISKLKMIKQ